MSLRSEWSWASWHGFERQSLLSLQEASTNSSFDARTHQSIACHALRMFIVASAAPGAWSDDASHCSGLRDNVKAVDRDSSLRHIFSWRDLLTSHI